MNNKTNFQKNYKFIIKALSNAQKCLYYNTKWKENEIDVSRIKSYEDFQKIPITTKEDYKNNLLDFIDYDSYTKGFQKSVYNDLLGDLKNISKYLNLFDLRISFTSGTTCTPLSVITSKEDIMNSYVNLNFYRNRYVNGILNQKYIWIWLINNNYFKYDNINEQYIEKKGGWQFFVNDFSDSYLAMTHDFIKKNNIKWMVCTPSFLYFYADFLQRYRLYEHDLLYIECQSEKLHNWQMEKISTITNAKICNVYSSNEIHFIGIASGSGIFRQINSNAFVEFLDVDNEKRAIITNVGASKMPLIRYDLGDIGKWVSSDDADDRNNKAFFVLEAYRSADKIILKDGRIFDFFVISQSITMLCSKLNLHINQYQVIQKAYDFFVYYIKIENHSKSINPDIIERFLSDFLNATFLLSNIHVKAKIFNSAFIIENSKYKYFKSEVLSIGK